MADEKIFGEQLSDAELDNVAGGTYLESSDDALKFKKLGIKVFDQDILGIPVLMHDQFVKLRDTFQQYGVTIEDHGGLENKNKYFIGGTEVTRDKAWEHIQKQFK